MRKANGMGSVTKIKSGRRRNPWIARVSIGYDDNGNMQRKTVGYYPTRKEAEKGLAEYLYLPENMRAKALKEDTSMTLEEAWNGWIAQAVLAKNTRKSYLGAYKKLSSYYGLPLNSVTTEQLQEMIDLGGSYATASVIKNVLRSIYGYAYAHEGCKASKIKLLDFVKLPKNVKSTLHKPFTDEEIQQCFEQEAIAAIVFIFTGLRISELMALTESDVDYEKQYLTVRQSKTAAGYREVPIPDGLIPYLKSYFQLYHYTSERGFKRALWKKKVLESHTTHDGRHTYVTILKRAGVEDTIIQKLVGHSGSVTQEVYTHISLKEKLAVVNRVFDLYFQG